MKQLITNLSNRIGNNVVTAGDFNTPLTTRDRSSSQTINTETMALKDTLDQMYFTDIVRTFHPKAAEYTFFSSAQGTFFKIVHIMGHKQPSINIREFIIVPAHCRSQCYETWNQPQHKVWKNPQMRGD